MHYDPRLIIQILQFMWNIYTARRSKSKPIPDDDNKAQEPPVIAEGPDPEKLKELITEIETKPTSENITTAIDKKFSPAQAEQVKDDFATFAALVSPPDFSDYDFSGLIQKYAKAMQTIAFKADLFRLRGWKTGKGFRILEMPGTCAALVPPAERNSAVYPIGEMISASVSKCKAVLTEELDRSVVIVL